MTPMTPDATDSRLIELEIRYSHLERLVEDLSRVVFEQGKTIDLLRVELLRMRSRMLDEGAETNAGQHEKPPHY